MTEFDDNRVTAPMEQIAPIIEKMIESGGTVEMTVTGNSMLPLLIDRVSSVKLTKPDGLRVGDVVLFKRNKSFVLHRISRAENGYYDIIGDNQYTADRNVPAESIIAKVSGFNRKGKRWKTGDAAYRAVLPAIKTVRRYGGALKRRLFKLINR